MTGKIKPISSTLYEEETGLSFVIEEETEFVKITSEEANHVFGEDIAVLDYFPTLLKYGETREYPLVYSRSQEVIMNGHRYVKYRIKNTLTGFDLAFKKEIDFELEMPKITRHRILNPMSPIYFKSLLGYEMHVTEDKVVEIPKDALYHLLYGAPDLGAFLNDNDLHILVQYGLLKVYTLPAVVHDNLVIERFILITKIKRIVIGGYREHEKKKSFRDNST